MRPITSILNPDRKYVSSSKTDLKKTFARIRRELAEADRKASESKLAKRRIVGA